MASADADWLDLVADLLARPLTELPEQAVTVQLGVTFQLVATAYDERARGRVAQRMWPLDEQFGGLRDELQRWNLHRSAVEHPLLRYYLATGDWTPRQVHDVPDRFADARVVGAWFDRSRSWGAPANLALPVHAGADGHRAFVLGRADPFTPDELALARRVHRLLVGLDRQVQALRALPAAPASTLELTPRERAVLALLAEGRTAAAIARRLTIGERTVHKHLERLYRKLEVRDRLGAVVRAQQLGLLPSSTQFSP